MANVSITKKQLEDNANVCAIICRTPITMKNTLENEVSVNNHCRLVKSTYELLHYFGDPFIDPKTYSDLIIAYKLVQKNIPVYISSVQDMANFASEDFTTSYNGYTEFTFKKYKSVTAVTYKLKSNIKFCVPIIQSKSDASTLTVYVSLYLLDNTIGKDIYAQNLIDPRNLYCNLEYRFKIASVTDKDLFDEFAKSGIELRVNNSIPSEDSHKLVDQLKARKEFTVALIPYDINIGKVSRKEYSYTIHSDWYLHSLDGDNARYSYIIAIDELAEMRQSPYLICLGKLSQYNLYYDVNKGQQEFDLDPYNYMIVYNHLLNTFNSDSDTYLFINAPDISFSSVVDLMNNSGKYEDAFPINDTYNCDMYFGYVSDYIKNSLYSMDLCKVNYSASALAFYSLMSTQSIYTNNPIGNLNIANTKLKSVIERDSAIKLADAHCNSVVLFDTGSPSIYGDRSLSTLPNLRYSHISRNFVRIRRMLREYIESIKFSLVNEYTMVSIVNFINSTLNDFKDNEILYEYSVEYELKDRGADITVHLRFNGIIQEINLNFII